MFESLQPADDGLAEEPTLTDEQIAALFWLPVIESCKETVTDETISKLITLGVIARNAHGRPELTPLGKVIYVRLMRDKEA